MDKKRLITSALPYVNNLPHLGNLIQVLSADVYTRYCRSKGYDTLYICGTDEYGTATETRAIAEGISAQELCDRYFKIHDDIYKWFDISFDKFGRTSTPEQTEIVQHLFNKIYELGYVKEKEIQQLYSEKSQMFLADRYIQGICPKCSYESARGDQCESCGVLLDSLDLIDPVSVVDKSIPVVKTTKHLYIDLPKLLPKLEMWVQDAKEKGTWSKNAIKMTEAWMRDGLIERAITRDLKWGIPVPHKGYEDKVFYVWFDAPIGYISITATHTSDWELWWKNPEEVELYQFIGKDNIPFHTVIFPATLLGSNEKWTMLHRISSSEYLNYEGGMFSKSKGIGVFGNDVQDTGIPVDVWRFYMMYNRPESSDYLFTWKDFKEAVNGELINNLSNLYSRTLTFISKNFDGKVLDIDLSDEASKAVWQQVSSYEKEITDLFEGVEIRRAYLKIFALSSYANKLMQDYEPWKLYKEDVKKAHWVLSNLAYIIKDIAVLIEPYTPNLAKTIKESLVGNDVILTWRDIYMSNTEKTILDGIANVEKPKHLLVRLEDAQIEGFKERFSGSQEEREHKEKGNDSNVEASVEEQFVQSVCLKVCKIKQVEQHPDADKLYVLRLDEGSAEPNTESNMEMRTIVSGIKDYYTPEDLEGRNIIVVANLKAAKLRGIRSNGMLLAASKREGEQETVEVIFVDDAQVGTIIVPEGYSPSLEYTTVKSDKFFEFTLRARDDYVVALNNTPLLYKQDNPNAIIKTISINDASVG